MSNNICLPKLHLLIIFICVVGLSSLYIHKNSSNNYYNSQLDNINIELNKYKTKLNENEAKTIYDRDANVINNVLVAPERREPIQLYTPQYIKQQLNIPTRGTPDNYHLIGLLLRNNTESAFNLFGRQSFPRSNKWEYYVQGTMHNTIVKIPLKIKGDKEIEDKQIIDVPGTDSSKGHYNVKLYNYESPIYNPYI